MTSELSNTHKLVSFSCKLLESFPYQGRWKLKDIWGGGWYNAHNFFFYGGSSGMLPRERLRSSSSLISLPAPPDLHVAKYSGLYVLHVKWDSIFQSMKEMQFDCSIALCV